MSYYPIMKAPGCNGWTTLCNFSPNNWEVQENLKKLINVSWVDDNEWISKSLGVIEANEMRTITASDLSGIVPEGVMPFLSMSTVALPENSEYLPQSYDYRSSIPAWRSSLGLSSSSTSTCYQGEVDPFPEHGSLLTFGPFIQFGNNIENYLLLLNLEKTAVKKVSKVEIYDANNKNHKSIFEAENNDMTIIPLDSLQFESSELPLVICKGMSAIPLYLSKTKDGSLMSLEHTHPPACYVVHGKRFEVQKILKDLWFNKVLNND